MLAKGLLYPYHTIIDHSSDLKTSIDKYSRKSYVDLLFIFVRISVKQPLFYVDLILKKSDPGPH